MSYIICIVGLPSHQYTGNHVVLRSDHTVLKTIKHIDYYSNY